MVNQQLLDYIRQQLAAGVSKEEIIQSLITTGWQGQDINDAFAAIGSDIAPSPTSVAQPNVVSGVQQNNPSQTPLETVAHKGSKPLILGILIVLILVIAGVVFAAPSIRKTIQTIFSSSIASTTSSSGILATTTITTVAATSTSVTSATTTLVSKTTQSSSTSTISPKEAYLIMRAAEEQIKTYSDVQAFILKYEANGKIKLAQLQQQISAVPVSERDGMENMLVSSITSMPSISEFSSITETVNGNEATLTITTTKVVGQTGIITMALEGNQWKVSNESWYNGAPPGPSMEFSVEFNESSSSIASLSLTDPLDRKVVFDVNSQNVLSNPNYSGGCASILGDEGCYIVFSPTYTMEGMPSSKPGISVTTSSQPEGTYTLTVKGEGNYKLIITTYAKDGSQEPTITQNETVTSGAGNTFLITFSASPGSTPKVIKS